MRQPDAKHLSVNLVAEVFLLLKEIEEVGVDRSSIELASQCLDTLTELVQGQRSIANAKTLLYRKCLTVLDRLLTRDAHHLPQCGVGQVVELRRAVAVFLLALLEGGEQHYREVVCLMRKELKLGGLRQVLEVMLMADQQDKDGPYRDAIFPLYVLMNRLMEGVNDSLEWQQYAEAALRPAQLPKEGRWLRGAVENVEIVNGRGELERVHFPVHPMCWLLTKQTRNAFLQEVKRSSLPAKLQGLMDASNEVMIPEMEHQMLLKEYTYRRLICMHSIWVCACYAYAYAYAMRPLQG